jgi:Uma2 family endonuclease
MPRVTTVPIRFENLGDVLRHLKGVHPSRIRLSPEPGTATVRDVIRMDRRRHEGLLCELVDGILVVKLGEFSVAEMGVQIGSALIGYQERHPRGLVAGASGLMQFGPRLVRSPTVSFVGWDQLPGRVVPRNPVPRIHPDLAVEVLCRGNTVAEMARKRADYFAAGTPLVWQVNPRSRTVDVYTAPDEFTTVAEFGTLDGGDVLPGFTLPVRSIFVNQPPAKPGRRKRR